MINNFDHANLYDIKYDKLNRFLNFNEKSDDTNINVELESRFEIDYDIQDILKKLNSLQQFSIINEKTVVEYHKEHYRIIIDEDVWNNTLDKNILTLGEYKDQKFNVKIDAQGYTINFAYSHEKSMEIERINNPKIRKRNRYIIKNFLNDKYELHLTSSFDPFTRKDKNLVEIEYDISKIKNIDDLIYPVKYVFDLMYVKSNELLDEKEIKNIVDIFNKYLVQMKYINKRPNKIDEENIFQHRLIRYSDNPVPIKTSEINNVKTKKYFVTNKLNGVRYFLFMFSGQVYLIGKTGSKFSKIPTHVWKIDAIDNTDEIFILDGEYFDKEYIDILKKKENKKITTFFAFDLLWYDNESKAKEIYQDRIEYLKKCCERFQMLPLEMKYMKYGDETINVLSYMKKKFKEEWDEENDGLIYTNVYNIYGSGDKDLNTYKWKFAHHQSIDVQVKNYEDNLYECYVSGYKDELEKFTDFYLYSPQKFIDGEIVEVSFDHKKQHFYPLRVRTDKEKPNFVSVAKDVWNDIHNEIKLSRLISKQLYLKNKEEWKNYRKYANSEKDKIIQNIDPNSIIVDIGFGKGGDILKYQKQGLKRIIGIEPDLNNVKEFFNRYNVNISDAEYESVLNKEFRIFDKKIKVKENEMHITIINHSGSDRNLKSIVNEQLKDSSQNIVVTMFFSLTYFFNNLDDFVILIYNINSFNPKPKQILGTVMDGKNTKLFLNKFNWDPEACGLDLRLIKENKLFISIEESATVKGHEEYLTDLERFENNLLQYKYQLKEKKYLQYKTNENNNLLKHFASLNCSFIFEYMDEEYNEENLKINEMNILLNSKLGLKLDSLYFYNCFMNMSMEKSNLLWGDMDEQEENESISSNLENFSKYLKLDKYFIKKEIYDDEELYYLVFKNKEYLLTSSNLNKVRALLLKNELDDSFRIVYEIKNEASAMILKKLFSVENIDNLIISNEYFYYFQDKSNIARNIIDLMEKIITPLQDYTFIEINPGIGIFTVQFLKIFKNIITITNGSYLNYNFLVNNVLNFFNMDKLKDDVSNDKENSYKINNSEISMINNYENENLNNFHSKSVIFVNYLFTENPNLNDILNKDCEYIVILSEQFIDIGKYVENFYLDIVKENYVYIISKQNVKSQQSIKKSRHIIQYLHANDKERLLELFNKMLKFVDISENEITEIISKFEDDNKVLFELNKLRFLKKKHNEDDNEKDNYRANARVKEIKNMFKENNIFFKAEKDSKYLDIGSGNGIITKKIGNSFGFSDDNIYGVEISNWVEKEHQKQETFVNTTYISGNSLPFENDSFEMISCIMSIHHFEYKNEMLTEIQRVLKPNGILIIREHEHDYTKELKMLIDLEHALFATVINEKMDNEEKVNEFWETYFGQYFSNENLKKDLNLKSLTKYFEPKGLTKYYWCAFKKNIHKNMLLISKKDLDELKTKLELDHEVCGFLLENDDNYIIVSEQENISSDNTRLNCQTKTYSSIIYHTHPKISKIYPSTEDIINVMLKNNSIIQHSIIITTAGIWNLSCSKKTLTKSKETEKIYEKVQKYLDSLYFQTNKGKIYTPYVDTIRTKLENELSISLRFDKWNDIKNDYIIQ